MTNPFGSEEPINALSRFAANSRMTEGFDYRAPNDFSGVKGLLGAQSGDGQRRTDGVFLQQPPLDLRTLPEPVSDAWEGQGFRGLMPPQSPATENSGRRGSQSGPADESALMSAERLAQGVVAHPVGLGLGALGLIMSGGNPLALLPGLGAAGTMFGNALTPDIKNMWTHQAREWLQEKYGDLFGDAE